MALAIKAKEACEILDINETTLYKYARTGLIPGQQIGGTWRFSEKALEDWLGSYNPETELSQLKLRLFNAEELNKNLASTVEELKGKLIKFEKLGELFNA